MIDESFTDEEIIDKLEKFLKENPNLYDDEELRIIRRSILWGKKGSLTYENIRQVSDELGIVDENTNIYTVFAKLINENFTKRRKTIMNSLSNSVEKEKLAAILKELDISEQARGENLTLEQFAKIADRI